MSPFRSEIFFLRQNFENALIRLRPPSETVIVVTQTAVVSQRVVDEVLSRDPLVRSGQLSNADIEVVRSLFTRLTQIWCKISRMSLLDRAALPCAFPQLAYECCPPSELSTLPIKAAVKLFLVTATHKFTRDAIMNEVKESALLAIQIASNVSDGYQDRLRTQQEALSALNCALESSATDSTHPYPAPILDILALLDSIEGQEHPDKILMNDELLKTTFERVQAEQQAFDAEEKLLSAVLEAVLKRKELLRAMEEARARLREVDTALEESRKDV
ncbi:hypothetical protein JCM11251_005415 [Rhodosporidiobolus azoricus]